MGYSARIHSGGVVQLSAPAQPHSTWGPHENRLYSAIVAGILGATLLVPATSAQANDVLGGWSEDGGAFAAHGHALPFAALAATPKHTGKAEDTLIGGTTHKRSHGWTTWVGTYHYTTAQLEHNWPYSGVIATSGRKWGTGGTEAVTKWVAYDPYANSGGHGKAKTYYGK